MEPEENAAREQLLAFAAGGERVVARVRLVLVGCILCIPAFQALYLHGIDSELLAGLVVAGVAFALALAYYLLARQQPLPWLSYVTSISDVTLVTATLAIFLAVGHPHAAVNSQVVWPIYLMAIAGTALRPRRWVVLSTTFVAIIEYIGIVLYASLHWDLNAPGWAPFPYGIFDWSTQISRMILMAITGLLTVAVIREIGHISRLAGTDSLTGIFNRTYFELRIEQEVHRARRYRRDLTLVMVDIDHFKHINDTLGHEFGDQALIKVTQYLKRGLRGSDILFRHGGDELAVLMPETSAYDAHLILQRVNQALHDRRIKGQQLTISAGIAALPADAGDATRLVKVADKRLYDAKHHGRDCIMPRLAELGQRDLPA